MRISLTDLQARLDTAMSREDWSAGGYLSILNTLALVAVAERIEDATTIIRRFAEWSWNKPQ